MIEARCLVCGNPLDSSAWFGMQSCGERSTKNDGAENEVCSEECLEIYTEDDESSIKGSES
jgi:predicted nucleic acid-binding Zn ribbon protein